MRLLVLAMVVLAVSLPAREVVAQGAEEGERDDGFSLHVNRDFRLEADETVDTLVVVRGDAVIEGTIRNALVVISGDLLIRGRVEGPTVIVRGEVNLEDSARIEDITIVRGSLRRAPGAVVGDIDRTSGFGTGWAAFVFGAILWIGATATVLLGGLAFALVGGRQLNRACDALTRKPAQTVLAAVVLAVGLPLVAVLLMITVVGIAPGLVTLLMVIPTLAFLGYLVVGTWLGGLLLSGFGRARAARPVLAALIGLGACQLVLLLPWLGFPIVVLGGLWGAGGLAYGIWRAVRGGPDEPPVPDQNGSPAPDEPGPPATVPAGP